MIGHPQCEQTRATERFHRLDFGHMDAEITFDDPVGYSKRCTIKVTYLLQPDSDILDYYCENKKDSASRPKPELRQ